MKTITQRVEGIKGISLHSLLCPENNKSIFFKFDPNSHTSLHN